MNRKILSAIPLLFLCPPPAVAQAAAGGQEISIGYGRLTTDELLDGYEYRLTLQPLIHAEVTNTSGVLAVNYKYVLNDELCIGFTFAAEQESGKTFDNLLSGGPYYVLTTQTGTFSRRVFTLAPELSRYYLNNRHFHMYATAGFGITYQSETQQLYASGAADNTRFHLNGYVSPFAIRAGGAIAAFIEFGYGYKGVINGGVSYHFNQ